MSLCCFICFLLRENFITSFNEAFFLDFLGLESENYTLFDWNNISAFGDLGDFIFLSPFLIILFWLNSVALPLELTLSLLSSISYCILLLAPKYYYAEYYYDFCTAVGWLWTFTKFLILCDWRSGVTLWNCFRYSWIMFTF